ncbi:MAG: hypothetical protein QOG96_5797, partial [Pseudonocardiales bacterium]|nr:hypothetical protein [Pseudonocardiales bacterium]
MPFVLINNGEQSVTSALAGILVAATPLFVAILAVWVDRSDRPKSRAEHLPGPGFSVLAGISLLGEEFTARSAAGLGLILLSSWLATRTRPARPARP